MSHFVSASDLKNLLRMLLLPVLIGLLSDGRHAGNACAETTLLGPQVQLQIQWHHDRSCRRSLILMPGENVALRQGMILRDAPLHREELTAQLKRQEHENWVVAFDTPATRGGVMVQCQGPPDATLHIVLRDENKLLGETTLTLRDLLQPSHDIPLPKGEGVLRITRQNISPIQILPRKSHVIHSPSEIFQAEVIGQFAEVQDRKRHPALHWELFEARTAKRVNQGRLSFQVPKKTSSSALAMDVQIPLPDQEGVYDLRCQLETRDGLQFGTTGVQLVVKGSLPNAIRTAGTSTDDKVAAVTQASAQDSTPAGPVQMIPAAEEIRSPIQRKRGVVLHRPWAIGRLWEDRFTEPETGRKITDWNTIATAAGQLTKELQKQGGNVLILGVYSDGVTLAPATAECFRSTAIDNAPLRNVPVDPAPKDVLEFLFREFDQQGHTLIPELDLTGVDESLEKLVLSTAGPRQEVELRNQAGQSWSQAHPGEASGAHYDSLAPAVQQRIEDLATGIMRRYQHHKSFGGVAIALHGETWACLPGVKWGRTPQNLPSPQSAEIVRSAGHTTEGSPLTATGVAERCRSLAELYARIGRQLDQSHGVRKVYLTMDRLLQTGTSREDATFLLRAGQSLENLFPYCGIEPKLLARDKSVRLMRPYLYAGQAPLSAEERTLLFAFNASPAITQTLQTANTIQLSHFELKQQPRENNARMPPLQDKTLSRLWSQAYGSGRVDELFVSWEASDELRVQDENSPARLMQKLPGWSSQTLAEVSQPLFVQKISSAEETCLVVVNEAPFNVTWEFQFAETMASPPQKISGEGKGPEKSAAESGGWKWELGPYEIQACRIPTATLQLSSHKLTVPPEELLRILTRIEQLEKTFVSIREGTPTEKYLLPNADFEQESKQPAQPPGWNYEYQSSHPPTLDLNNPRSGKHSLKLVCEKTKASTRVTTFPLSLNREKHIAVSLWMRAAHPETPMRLTFSGPLLNDWSKSTEVKCGPEWQHYVFRISDIPEEVKQAVLKIDLSQLGAVWIDDVEMFPQRITPNDERQLTRNLSAIRLAWQEQRYTDCLRLLDGYWARFLTDSPRTSTSSEPRLPQLGTRYRELIIR